MLRDQILILHLSGLPTPEPIDVLIAYIEILRWLTFNRKSVWCHVNEVAACLLGTI